MSDLSRSVVKVAGGASVVTLVGGGLVVGGGVAEAQTFTASTEAELNQAILDANNAAGADTITISAGTITLTSDLETITDELTITGEGQLSTIIDGIDSHSVFYAVDAASLTIEDLTIQNAYRSGDGSAIIAKGTDLTISYVTFDSNEAEFGGGAVFFDTTADSGQNASLSISNSTFTGNLSGDQGGAVLIYNGYSYLDASITDSTFNENSAPSTYGGAVKLLDIADGEGGVTYLSIIGSTFTNNSTYYGGGAVMVYGGTKGDLATSVTIEDSTFTDNQVTGGEGAGGGAVWAFTYGSLSIDNSSFTDNSVGGYGGAVYLETGHLTISDSEFVGNTAGYGGGGIEGYELKSLTVTNSSFTDNSAVKHGGAIYFTEYSADTTMSIENSTFSGNEAGGDGGAVQAGGTTIVIDQSTFTGNTAGGDGGAAYLSGGVTVRNTTITSNTAAYAGGVQMSSSVELTIVNTILSGNTETVGTGGDDLRIAEAEGLPPFSIDHSIVGVSTVDVAAAGTGNIVSSDPMLGALGDNGGDTETMVPLSGSPVIDAGDSSVHEFDTDQRGQARVQGVIDIGAVEVQPAPPTTTTVPAPTTTVPVPAILPPTGSGSRTGVLAALLTGFGAVLTLGASRRRRTN